MGFNSWTTHLILATYREREFDSSSLFGLGGRQSVFLQPSQIVEIAQLYGHDPKDLQGLFDLDVIDQDTLRTKNSVRDSAYIYNLLGMKTFSFDATAYENAERILDLNSSFDLQMNLSELS